MLALPLEFRIFLKMRKNTLEIRNNTIILGIFFTKFRKIFKIWKNTLKIQKNANENSKNGSHIILDKKIRKMPKKIKNSEKYMKTRKNSSENLTKNTSET